MGDERIRIVEEEQREGKIVWSEMDTTVDGKPAKLLACKEWGLVLLGDRCLALPQYPLQKLESIILGGRPAEPSSGERESPDVA